MKTLISFNRGGKWVPLNAPEKSSHGVPLNCHVQNGCSLHLHSYSSEELPYPYSTETAVGLIMGVGNVGKQLSFIQEELNTYLSRDGGMTWLEVKKGPYVMEFGDHGSIIVMAPMFKPTRELWFTFDEGLNWDTVIISDSMVDVDNIRVEPQSISQKFIVHGHYSNSEAGKGLIVSIDFGQLNTRVCKGVDNPTGSESDYELWTPYDGRQGTNKCFLGKYLEFVRRKRDADCINGVDHEMTIYKDDCECTEMDFECDEGYK